MSSRQLLDRIGSFTAVPNQFIDDTRLSHLAFRVFVYLRRCTNTRSATETAWPAYESMMAACNIGTRKNLAKALQELGDAGWLERHRRWGQSTVYVLKMPDQPESAPAPVVEQPKTVESNGQTTPSSSSHVGTISRSHVGTIVVPRAGTLTRRIEQEESIKREGAPARAPRAPRSSAFGVVHTEHADPRVAAYLTTLRSQITDTNARLIMERVAADRMDVWCEVLTVWAMAAYRADNFSGMFDRYDTVVNSRRIAAQQPIKPAAASGKAGLYVQVADKGGQELEAARALARQQREARRKEKGE